MLLQKNTEVSLFDDMESEWVPPKPAVNIYKSKAVDLFGYKDSIQESEEISPDFLSTTM